MKKCINRKKKDYFNAGGPSREKAAVYSCGLIEQKRNKVTREKKGVNRGKKEN